MGRDDAADAMGRTELWQAADAIEALALWLRRQVPYEVSATTFTALDTLQTHGPLRVSELAAREALTQPGTTTLVNRLESAGYAERAPDPSDGRAQLVAITVAGREVLSERHHARTTHLVHALQQLPAAQREALLGAVPAIETLTDRERVSS